MLSSEFDTEDEEEAIKKILKEGTMQTMEVSCSCVPPALELLLPGQKATSFQCGGDLSMRTNADPCLADARPPRRHERLHELHEGQINYLVKAQ